MHVVAELGAAAHWYYKDLIYRPEIAKSKSYRNAWRSTMQIKAASPAELLGFAKAQLLKSRVFVLVGDKTTVLNLRKGATALDAAFAIHSSLGLRAEAVIVNGHESSMDQVLQNGDIISVKRSKDAFPDPNPVWLTFVTTDSAKRVLRNHLNKEKEAKFLSHGLIHLLMLMSRNTRRIQDRYFGLVPDAKQLVRFVQQRFPGDTVDTFLMRLGGADKNETIEMASCLLDIPTNELKVTSLKWALRWVRMQSKHGYSQPKLLSSILIPFLTELLPKMGYDSAQLEYHWTKICGPDALANKSGSYFAQLLPHLTIPPKSDDRR
jgi:(p)ppGpp synthase/HD superfamily hydrolase